jgi:hypothetical protein
MNSKTLNILSSETEHLEYTRFGALTAVKIICVAVTPGRHWFTV